MTDITREELELCERLLGRPLMLGRVQLCGCIICTCKDEIQCQGCGAKNCGKHPPSQLNYEPNADDLRSLIVAAELCVRWFNDGSGMIDAWTGDFAGEPDIKLDWPTDGTETQCVIKAAAEVMRSRKSNG